MWNPFKRKANNAVSPVFVKKTGFRNNMWVMTPRGIGILFEYKFPLSTIHLINPNGETTKELSLSVTDLRQALWKEIPISRRGVSKEVGQYLGYE